MFSAPEIEHGYIVLLQIVPLFYNLRDWKQCLFGANMEEHESFKILSD